MSPSLPSALKKEKIVAKIRNKKTRGVDSRVKVERPAPTRPGFDFQNNRSAINLVLGAAVLVVLGVVLFNFLSTQRQTTPEDLGPAQQVETPRQGDVAKENLPGKYTVKKGDTLFTIAQNYYGDGYKYPELVRANNLTDENTLEVGQVLEIPRLADTIAQASPGASPASTSAPESTAAPAATEAPVALEDTKSAQELGTGGDPNQTAWGPRISGNSYTVQAGDWLSKIAGRAYGDIMAYQKLAQANNISNPDLIEVGMTLKIPR